MTKEQLDVIISKLSNVQCDSISEKLVLDYIISSHKSNYYDTKVKELQTRILGELELEEFDFLMTKLNNKIKVENGNKCFNDK